MIDLQSDTVTLPDDAMRDAAHDAVVGNAKLGTDPTVRRLESQAAALLGMESALFCPSGTMGNQASCRVHTERGQEVLVEVDSHVYNSEYGGLAHLSGLQPRPIDGGDRGVPTPAEIRAGIRANGKCETSLLVLENTHNKKGGVAVEPQRLAAAAQAAHEAGLSVHLDGARLFNAAVALNQPLDSFTEHVDSVMVSVSKGLGGPVGSLVAGSASFIEAAEHERNALGGGMRQAGMIAAPALVALDNVDRLADDHENARRLADGLAGIDGLEPNDPETNIVLVDVSKTGVTAARFCELLESEGVSTSEFGEHTVRLCTHLGIDADDVERAVAILEAVVATLE